MSKEFPKWWLITSEKHPMADRDIVFAFNPEEALELMDDYAENYSVTLLTMRGLGDLIGCVIPDEGVPESVAIGPILFMHKGERIRLHG